jgi:hypothetical protein
MTQPELPTQPLRSIILTQEQSDQLTDATEPGQAFIVLGLGS